MNKDKPQFPLVTVIMPIFNEANFIKQSLGAVLTQDYPHERMEVLIADGGSSDGTRRQIAALIAQADITVTVLHNPQRIAATGLNKALLVAKGDIVARVDGHTVIAPDYVRQCVLALQRTSADNVGGRMDATGVSRIGQTIALALNSPFGVGGARFHYSAKEEEVDTVYLGAWRRTIFADIGLFDEQLAHNQDDEFNYRLRGQGGRILLTPAIKSRYYCRNTIGGLARQYFHFGFWKVRVLQKHPRQMQSRQFAPPLFVAFLFGVGLLAPFSVIAKKALLSVSSLYALLNAACSISIARRYGWRHLLLLPVVFATLHLNYGSGFLIGLVRFGGKWVDSEKQWQVAL